MPVSSRESSSAWISAKVTHGVKVMKVGRSSTPAALAARMAFLMPGTSMPLSKTCSTFPDGNSSAEVMTCRPSLVIWLISASNSRMWSNRVVSSNVTGPSWSATASMTPSACRRVLKNSASTKAKWRAPWAASWAASASTMPVSTGIAATP